MVLSQKSTVYFQVVSVIPGHFVESARANSMGRLDMQLNSMFQFSPEISINWTKMKKRDYYRLLINKEPIELKANNSKWERDLQIDQTSLETSFGHVKSAWKDNKLREFYFKLPHRIVVSKKELFLFGKAEDTKCPYCEKNDSIIHTFHSCNWSQLFFLEAIKWFNKEKMSPPSAFHLLN